MPIFETDEERTYFLTTFLIHPDFNDTDDGINVGINDGINDGKTDHANLTNHERTVLYLIQQNQMITAAEIAVSMGVSARTAERTVKSLKEKGLIAREGAKRNGRWIILK